jgi:biopolymer transport protein ExbB
MQFEKLTFDPKFVLEVWFEGGWVMIPLALLTLFIYYQSTALIFHLNSARIKSTHIETWLEWIEHPVRAAGHIGDVINYVIVRGFDNETITRRVGEVKEHILAEVNPKIILLSVLVTVAPLMGLLGTVIGMLSTFKALASNAGQTVDMVADGVRVALITTQTGLIIAIPGYILLYAILKRRNEYIVFLSQLENFAIQHGNKIKAV